MFKQSSKTMSKQSSKEPSLLGRELSKDPESAAGMNNGDPLINIPSKVPDKSNFSYKSPENNNNNNENDPDNPDNPDRMKSTEVVASSSNTNTNTRATSQDSNVEQPTQPVVSKHVVSISQQEMITPVKRKVVLVGLRFRIDQLATIDTVHQTYHALCSLDMDWDATENDIANHAKSAREYTPEKVPRIDPKNVVVKSVSYKPWANGNLYKLVNKNGKFYNLRRIEYDAVWSEPFEVKNFPFDVQDLTFVFQSRSFNNTDKRKFVPSRVFGDFFRVEKTYLSVADWELRRCDAFVHIIDWIYIYSKGETRDPTGARTVPRMYFRIQVQRLAKPILVRVVFWMFLLGVLSFGAFGIDPNEIGDRLAYATTMVLALVAFQFITSTIIPSVPYLTLIDKYNLLILIFIVAIGIESTFVGWYYIEYKSTLSEQTLVDIDQGCLIAFSLLYLIAHIWFGFFFDSRTKI